jgi:hypothetical protein
MDYTTKLSWKNHGKIWEVRLLRGSEVLGEFWVVHRRGAFMEALDYFFGE